MLVIGSPIYNFAIPSTLKAWLDDLIRAGVTFKYTATRPQGFLLVSAIVLTARGAIHSDANSDHREPCPREVMSFTGIYDDTFIHAEGVNRSKVTRPAWLLC